MGEVTEFRERDQTIVLDVPLDDAARRVGIIERMIEQINSDIKRLRPTFAPRVSELIERRKAELAEHGDRFEGVMRELGIALRRRPEAGTPVDVRVRRDARVLREKAAVRPSATQPYLDEESVRQLVDLIDQSGKGFETAPATYAKLGEEDLRNIILGHLNAVFGRPTATGEAFSVHGKTDILLAAGGGNVFIAECKIWDGPALYTKMIDQLFEYVTWRQTAAALVTFSQRRGLSSVVAAADQAVQDHPSYRGGFAEKSPTYRVSNHEHPSDAQKRLTLHHLFFDLFPGERQAAVQPGPGEATR